MLSQQLVNGVFLGAVYTLVALAFSLNMGILGVLNLAIADFFMIGGFVGLALLLVGAPLPVVVLAALIAGALLALVLENTAYRPLGTVDPIVTLLSTIGFGLILQNFATVMWGTDPSFFPGHQLSARIPLGPVRVGGFQILSLAVTIVLVSGLWYLTNRTKMGRGLRAVAENREAAVVLGVNVKQAERTTFLISGVLACGAGVLLGLSYGVMTPHFGIEIGIAGIAAMILGGVTSIWGSLIAGPVLGLAAVLSTAYLGGVYQNMVVFGILILTLILRPQGLLGRADATAGRV